MRNPSTTKTRPRRARGYLRARSSFEMVLVVEGAAVVFGLTRPIVAAPEPEHEPRHQAETADHHQEARQRLDLDQPRSREQPGTHEHVQIRQELVDGSSEPHCSYVSQVRRWENILADRTAETATS